MKIVVLLIALNCLPLYSQGNEPINQVQLGATIKAKFEFAPNSKNEPIINFRISSSVGAASHWLSNDLYPSVNAEFQLYNGGFGSRSMKDFRYATFDAIVAFTLTAGHLYSGSTANGSMARNVPLRYFSDFAIPSLQTPYNYSFSLGTNLVFTTDRGRSFQRLGFFNFNHSGVQLSYYNDGTPFQHFLLGDGKDRYYTGGGTLSYNNGYGSPSNLRSYSIEVSYHKFTGYCENSFELSSDLNSSNVDYHDPFQRKYNKSLWRVNVFTNGLKEGKGITYAYYNSTSWDGQHLIHWFVKNSYHIVPYKGYWDIEPSFYLINNQLKN